MIQINTIPRVVLGLLLLLSVCFTYKIDWQCDWDLYYCDYPYNIEQTLHFRCRDIDDCPDNFMCCSHRCFRHKICQPSKNIPQTPKLPSNNFEIRPGQCDIIVTCDTPLPAAFTKSMECLQDDDCPDNYKCCFVSCYNHKVCQPVKDVFGKTFTEPALFTKTTADDNISNNSLSESSVTKTTISKISTESTKATVVSETIPNYISVTTTTTLEEMEELPSITRTEPTTSAEFEITSIKHFQEPITTTSQEIIGSLTEPFTTTTRRTTEATFSESATKPSILTTSGTITYATTIKSSTEPANSTSTLKLTTNRILTENSTLTEDFEASGDLEVIYDDDEDGRKELEDDVNSTTSTLQQTKDLIEATIRTTLSQTLPRELSTKNNDFEASGDLVTTEDDEDQRKEEEDNSPKLIINATASTSTAAPQSKISNDSIDITVRTTQPQPHVGSTNFITETDDFETTVVLEITEYDGDERKEGINDISTTIQKLISNTTFKLTTPQQIDSRKKVTDITMVTTQTQSLTESTRHLVEDDAETENTNITVLLRNNYTATGTPIYQTTRRNYSTEVTLNTTQSQPLTESNSDLEIVGGEGSEKKEEENIITTSSTTQSTSNTTTFTRVQSLRESTRNLIEDDEEIEKTHMTELLRNNETATVTTVYQATRRNNSIEVPLNTTQPQPHTELNTDLEVVEAHGSEKKEEENKITTSSTTQATMFTLTTEQVNISKYTTVTQAEPMKGSTALSTESDDFEASGDLEITGDDEDMEKVKHITITTQRASTKRSTEGTSNTNQSQPLGGTTVSAKSDDSEASGDFEIIGDDEDENGMEEGKVTVSTTTKLINRSETSIISQENATVKIIQAETDDFEASGDLEIFGDDEDENERAKGKVTASATTKLINRSEIPIVRPANTTFKITQSETDDIEASGDLEIFGDDEE
ncbi:uncharacterized protein LOC108904923 [Anoplophora glabripennis]|uniref:uncharacterized protein LOC108904923 n=1 Tax=Anoplophora glabripennis TaxID=217634 RepID=UPI000874A190|nr:uncharacterized protein LOC108904923 [Anoplophora glabripennis]